MDNVGNEIWNRTYGGGTGNDYGYSIIHTNDGGYIIAGITRSQGNNNGDAWIIKTDNDGNADVTKKNLRFILRFRTLGAFLVFTKMLTFCDKVMWE